MKKVISFLILAIVFALLISCRSTHKCVDAANNNENLHSTEVTTYQTEVA